MSSSAPPAAPRRLYPAVIVAVALVLRVAVVLAIAHSKPDVWFFGGGTELGLLAQSIRTGHGISSPFGGSTGPSAFLAPGYPALVAATFALLGPYSHASAVFLMLLQALFGTATVWVMMSLARRLFGDTVAVIAGTIWAVCPFALFLPALFWETSLSILLATSLVALAVAAWDRHTVAHWLGMGLVAALVFAVNPSLLPIVAGTYGWALYRARRRSLLAPALGVLLCIALAAPWVIRNEIQLHAFIPMRSNAGYELWQGNRPGADGYFTLELHPTESREQFERYAPAWEKSPTCGKNQRRPRPPSPPIRHDLSLLPPGVLWRSGPAAAASPENRRWAMPVRAVRSGCSDWRCCGAATVPLPCTSCCLCCCFRCPIASRIPTSGFAWC